MRKSDREPAGRVVVAKEGFGDRSASEFPWIPGFQNGWNVVFRPVDRQGATILQNQDDWFSCGSHSLQQLLLIVGQTEVRAIESLALYVLVIIFVKVV